LLETFIILISDDFSRALDYERRFVKSTKSSIESQDSGMDLTKRKRTAKRKFSSDDDNDEEEKEPAEKKKEKKKKRKSLPIVTADGSDSDELVSDTEKISEVSVWSKF